MSQTVVPTFYSTRKRYKDNIKNAKGAEIQKLSEIIVKDSESKATTGDSLKTPKNKTKGKKLNKVTNYFKSKPETSKKLISEKGLAKDKNEIPRTPKRNLSNPEELTPSKKKPLIDQKSITVESSPSKLTSQGSLTPKKLDPIARKLHLGSPNRYVSPKKLGSPFKKEELTPQKIAMYENLSNHDLASLVNESRSKILFSGRLDELKKSLEKFSNVSAKTKEFQSNSYKITSVISSVKTSNKEVSPLIQGEPAYKKFSYLAAPHSESTLILPHKYKLLAETFRCLDTVVQMLNNRKEKITFEKVRNGVQKMMNKNFLMNHMGQIMTVLPTAYSLNYEKIDAYTLNKNSSLYQLIITPNLFDLKEDSTETLKEQGKNIQKGFTYMTPQHLLERKNIFFHSLTKIVKKYHQEFLMKLNFPTVSEESIVRWHPKFVVDSVPDIPIAALPEEPESKVCTAKDVLNKIKGSARSRVEKALQSVSEGQINEPTKQGTSEADAKKSTVNKKQHSALKGICTDLLEKIRARESAKLIETMTRSIQDEKRLAMLERVPKIVHILWHFFIAERKSAVPVDTAVDKIIHSLNSLTTPEDVKEHLQLITEAMPGWLSFIRIPKGVYITIDKKKDINVMLDNLK